MIALELDTFVCHLLILCFILHSANCGECSTFACIRLRDSHIHNNTSATWVEIDHPKRPPASVVPVQALMEILLAEDGDVHRRTGKDVSHLRKHLRKHVVS